MRDAGESDRGVLLIAIDRQAGDDGRENRDEPLVYFAQAAGDFDGGAVNAERDQGHAGRAADETTEHNDIEANDDRVQ